MIDYFEHSGKAHDEAPPGRGSGRYAWGSGENPGQHDRGLRATVKQMKSNGISESEIAKALFGERASINKLRAELSLESNRDRMMRRQEAIRLLDEYGGNQSEVARKMGINESSVRNLLNNEIAERKTRIDNTADILRKACNEKGVINVSTGTELLMGVTDTTKKTAIEMLKNEGYTNVNVKIPQMGTNHETTLSVLAPPGMSFGEIQKNRFNVQPITEFSSDQGKTWFVPERPTYMDSKRILIRYAEDGGVDRDGVIQIRRGVPDLSLGNANYAQLRIGVDGTHYMKGMGHYSDDIPKGYDVIYNTNKKKGTPPGDVFKKVSDDPNNPFSALIKPGGQYYYTDTDGKRKLSPLNKLREEGDWSKWSKDLASQFLGKQPEKLIKQQIDLTISGKRAELDDIKALTNPVVKKKMLQDFSDGCDRQASDLNVTGFKNQSYHVLLPVPDIKPKEVYAPNFKNGEQVALVRYPHGGTFEIPILTVNNNTNSSAKDFMKNAKDAIGIHPSVAERLSGADFDGDTAMTIPMKSNGISIRNSKMPKELEGFNPKSYKMEDDVPRIKYKTMQSEMGKVTNLIMDMTVAGATPTEIAYATRHSMVTIDSYKHHLDYKQSYKDHKIAELKAKYQGLTDKGHVKGASTIFTKAGSEDWVPERKEVMDKSKMTPKELKRFNEGYKVFRDADPIKFKDGVVKKRMVQIPKMDLTDDAFTLVRDKNNKKEVMYAEYANELKRLANDARKTFRNTKNIEMDKAAKKKYENEVASLNAKLKESLMNSPKEQQAQIIANAIMSDKYRQNPDMTKEEKGKEKQKALDRARAQVGAKRAKVEFTDKEWEAVQAGAISSNKLAKLIDNADPDKVKQLATPKQDDRRLTGSKVSLIKQMKASGMYTAAEIAERVGVSPSTVNKTE